MTAAIAEPKKPSAAPPPEHPADAGSPSVNIAVSRIVPSPWNRKAEVTAELVESVRQHGVLENVILRPYKAIEEDVVLYSMKADPFVVGESIFQLVAGERRWRAAKEAGRSHVPAAVRHLSDIEAMAIQIEENEQRENLSPMDRAEAYDNLRSEYMKAHGKDRGYTEAKCIDQVAAKVRRETRTVYQVIQLKKLIWQAQAALRNGEIEASHGYEMCRRSEEEQLELLKWIRFETQHSKGDVPSVRRLKDKIKAMDIAADEKRRQKTPVDAGGFKPQSIMKEYRAAQAQAAASPALNHGIDNRKPAPAQAPKPPTKAQLKAAKQQREQEKERRAAAQKREEKQTRSTEIERQARVMAVEAIAKKAKLDRSLIDMVAVDILKNSEDDVSQFAARMFNWPKPRGGKTFSWTEIEKIGLAHVPKLKPGQLAGLLIAGLLSEEMFVYAGGRNECERLEAMARKYKVNLGKIRKDLATKAKQPTAAKKKGAAA